MNPALKVFQTYIFAPLHRFRQNFFSRNAAGNFFGVITDFVFDCSKETALIMLVFNAVSIISSHIAQIGGLRKSKRDNKDYLINHSFTEDQTIPTKDRFISYYIVEIEITNFSEICGFE